MPNKSLAIIKRLACALLISSSCCALAAEDAEAPALDVKCVLVDDYESLGWQAIDKHATALGRSLVQPDGGKSTPGGAPDAAKGAAPAKGPDGTLSVATNAQGQSRDAVCRGRAQDAAGAWDNIYTQGKLIGAGDLEVVVTRASYDEAIAYHRKNNTALLLYVNGVPLPADAELIAVDPRGSFVSLRYRIKAGKESQTLWAMLYRNAGLTALQDLRVSLGWAGSGPKVETQETDGNALVAVTNPLAEYLAFGMVVLLTVFVIRTGRTTDALRDSPSGDWWIDVRALRGAIRGTWWQRISKNTPDADALIRARYPSYDAQNRQPYVAAAHNVIGGGDVSAERQTDTIIGLALVADERRLRSSYSLSRVQLAMWFLFAVAAGVFLWLVYGQLPAIDGSLLALLGLSIGTAGVSLAVVPSSSARFTPTQGLWRDLVTGPDDKHQVHRYQAVIVNILLLIVGVTHVVQQLTYPIFDATWLALLGVSGATLSAGKQLLEKDKTVADTGANPPPAAGGSKSPPAAVG